MIKNKISLVLLLSLLTGCNFSISSNNQNTNSSSSLSSEVDELSLEHSITVISNDNCSIEVLKTKAFRNEVINV